MTVVVGIDLSLTSTGIAVVNHSELFDSSAAVSRVISKGREDATLEDRYQRLLRLTNEIGAHCGAADLVVVEQPAFSRTTGHMHDRSGLWWLVVTRLKMQGIRVVDVSPTTRARYATGKGNASKDTVLASVVRRYPQVDVQGNDEADALVLAAMGARYLELSIEDSLPKTHLAAMDAVSWPDARTEAAS